MEWSSTNIKTKGLLMHQNKLSPLAPLSVLPYYMRGKGSMNQQCWYNLTEMRISNLRKSAEPDSFIHDTMEKIPKPFRNSLAIRDLTITCKEYKRVYTGEALDPTWLENLSLSSTKPPPKMLSYFYSQLLLAPSSEKRLYLKAWEQELQISISDIDVKFILAHSHGFSRSIRLQENSFKILTRWYRTPDFLHKINLIPDNKCWRCLMGEGTISHIWWSCPSLSIFWEEIGRQINAICNVVISLTPELVLLWKPQLDLTPSAISLPTHLIAAAKMLIPKKWKEREPPRVGEWLEEIHHICLMEELVGWNSGKRDMFLRSGNPGWISTQRDYGSTTSHKAHLLECSLWPCSQTFIELRGISSFQGRIALTTQPISHGYLTHTK
ncbi:uncharacterized protein LOC122939895 isoform X1 [Bufo gargarizans]|uniref:uncharacterized protein LOC122939895 isoform X1 n=1 Tax=Bufo gargarizans TaxID=30331 RepID=UPI001CF2B30D|nr:uncharacterized protein LOC122939895 isoform X1 [Bufo gargarizans]